ncbi:MAG TPA: ABC transporter ATP-binding protein [Candidatus Kapabacteria bacterium]|nr:MAG: High-affinity branched-chain amino acid transport ATP-binding protein LivF [Chloroflexi bacterium ADurb.Bin344]HNY18629.1 ABC transporter ATP-binding protein [Flexilinea sp.]HOV93226.1 ABC transporter ATP-binding protein [Candidatus Kapabacteria bacterium]
MLEIKNLVVTYGGIPALFGVDLYVNTGEVVSVVGSNGAGKSTLLRAISGLMKPESGEILYNNESIGGLPAHEVVKKGIIMVPEGRLLFGKMNIFQNLMMGAYQVDDKKEIESRLEKVYSIFPRLKEREKQLAGTLSGGEQQMVAIARGLMSNPQVLMLDEPSLGLAPIMVKEMFNLLREIKKEKITILLVEQRLREALNLSDRAYVLQTGRIVMSGTGEELINAPEVKQAYLGI